jgi:hypothetical protein
MTFQGEDGFQSMNATSASNVLARLDAPGMSVRDKMAARIGCLAIDAMIEMAIDRAIDKQRGGVTQPLGEKARYFFSALEEIKE